MSVDIGINFRATSGYVTDGANETYCLGDAYPTTRGGVTFGWTSVGQAAADRASGNDRRLAGINYSAASSVQTFQVDLPAPGTYEVHLAIGDANGGLSSTVARIRDNGSTLATINQVSTSANNFTDATGVNRTSAANWVSGEAALTGLVFATTTFQLDVSSDSVAFEGFAHLRIYQAGGGGGGSTNLFYRRRR